MSKLIIFYDSKCPLCCYEMDKLIQHDHKQNIELVDIFSSRFTELSQSITRESALKKIHGIYKEELIAGIDVNYWAWTLVGKRHWVLLLKAPLTRQLAQITYYFFARYREQISSLLNYIFKLESKQCASGGCNAKSKPFNNRR